MLSSQEQRVWADVQRFWAMEAEEPTSLAPYEPSSSWSWHDEDDLPVALAAGVWIAIALILFGAVVAGLVVAGVTALAWALWRSWPGAGGAVAPRVATRASEVSSAPGALLDPAPASDTDAQRRAGGKPFRSAADQRRRPQRK